MLKEYVFLIYLIKNFLKWIYFTIRYYLKERINKALKEKLIERVYKNVKIEFAENQNNAGMLGALYNFKSR